MVIKVLIDTGVKKLNKVYDYLVDNDLSTKVAIGKRVRVNFGKGKGRETEGIIVKIIEDSSIQLNLDKLKQIQDVLDDISYIDESKLKLAKWMAKIYFCNVYSCLRLMFPTTNSKKLSKKSIELKKEEIISLNKPIKEIKENIQLKKIKASKQVELLSFLIENGETLKKDITLKLNIKSYVIKELINKGYILCKEIEEKKETSLKALGTKPSIVLNNEQKYIVNELSKKIESKLFNESLIYGVTGSGKTEVYMELIKKVIDEGKTAIVLVPEISLTPQTKARFISRFGSIVGVIHSEMEISKRKEELLKIIKGDTKIVIGPRSAMFVPIKNIGLIIIDEEHDQSYISSKTPKYNTREVAKKICIDNDALLVLGSATPLITTMFEAKTSKIDLYTLQNRASNKSVLPTIKIVDMKKDIITNLKSKILSSELISAIGENIKKHEQTFIFINRRGYNSYIYCKTCGKILKCKNCDVSLTYHKTSDLLLCHYCSYSKFNETTCPYCKSEHSLIEGGLGTEKVVEELQNLFCDAKILRMDRDTTIKKDSSEKILKKFVDEKIDILVGTQMISKGHDIKNVTLVGIVNADSLFSDSNYLSIERGFSNLLQVSGRAGRGDKKGIAIVQAYDTENYIFDSLIKNDYIDFYNKEIKIRKMLNYAPYSDIFVIELTSTDRESLKLESKKLYEFLSEAFDNFNKLESVKCQIYSPVVPYISKISKNYRIQLLIKTKICDKVYDLLYQNLQKYDKILGKNINLSINRNPINI